VVSHSVDSLVKVSEVVVHVVVIEVSVSHVVV